MGAQDAFDNGGYYAEVKVMKVTDEGLGEVSLGLSAEPYDSLPTDLVRHLDAFPRCWFVGSSYEDDFSDPTMAVYCDSVKKLRFMNARAKGKPQQVMIWRQGQTLGFWMRKRDEKSKEWLATVFINHNRLFTCSFDITEEVSKFRVCVEARGAVKSTGQLIIVRKCVVWRGCEGGDQVNKARPRHISFSLLCSLLLPFFRLLLLLHVGSLLRALLRPLL